MGGAQGQSAAPPAAGVPGPNRELTRDEYDRLAGTAYKRGKTRLGLLMETICATGIRVSEVKYITVEAVQCGKAELSLKGKIRAIMLPGKLCRKLLKYAKKQKTASGEIFLTRNGRELSRRQIWAEMRAVCKSAGVEPTKVFPHNLRHLFATVFYRACLDLVCWQLLTTDYYRSPMCAKQTGPKNQPSFTEYTKNDSAQGALGEKGVNNQGCQKTYFDSLGFYAQNSIKTKNYTLKRRIQRDIL